MSRETQPTNGRLVWISDADLRTPLDSAFREVMRNKFLAAPENAVEAITDTLVTNHGAGAPLPADEVEDLRADARDILITLGIPRNTLFGVPVVSPPVGEDACQHEWRPSCDGSTCARCGIEDR